MKKIMVTAAVAVVGDDLTDNNIQDVCYRKNIPLLIPYAR